MRLVQHMLRWHSNVFGIGLWIEMCVAEMLAHGEASTPAMMTGKAWNVVVHENSISNLEVFYAFAYLCYRSGRLMAEDDGCPIKDVPLHSISTA